MPSRRKDGSYYNCKNSQRSLYFTDTHVRLALTPPAPRLAQRKDLAPGVLYQVMGEVGQVSGDRAYDSATCYQAIRARGAVPTLSPRRNA